MLVVRTCIREAAQKWLVVACKRYSGAEKPGSQEARKPGSQECHACHLRRHTEHYSEYYAGYQRLPFGVCLWRLPLPLPLPFASHPFPSLTGARATASVQNAECRDQSRSPPTPPKLGTSCFRRRWQAGRCQEVPLSTKFPLPRPLTIEKAAKVNKTNPFKPFQSGLSRCRVD